MENATKALLIAAAVLVTILIISLGLVVYNMASETMDSVNFSGQEVTAFNDKFTQYEGQNVRGSQVNAMLKTVLSSNLQSASEGLQTPANGDGGNKFVQVTGDVELATNAVSLGGAAADTSAMYSVTLTYDPETGFVTTIDVAAAGAAAGPAGP